MKIIKIDENNKVKLVGVAKGVDLEKEAQKIGGIVYDGDIPQSKHLKWENSKVVIDEELEIQAKVEDTQKALINLCDQKQDAIKTMILGYKNTKPQQERYENKYERALKVKADIEANTTPTETNQKILTDYQTIIAKYEYAKSQIEKFIDLIESFRTKVDDMIKAGEIDKANELIALAQNFGADTTQDDIDNLFL